MHAPLNLLCMGLCKLRDANQIGILIYFVYCIVAIIYLDYWVMAMRYAKEINFMED